MTLKDKVITFLYRHVFIESVTEIDRQNQQIIDRMKEMERLLSQPGASAIGGDDRRRH